jgi:hypothetical protein
VLNTQQRPATPKRPVIHNQEGQAASHALRGRSSATHATQAPHARPVTLFQVEGGRVTAAGSDDTGEFTLEGTLDGEGDFVAVKKYPRHQVYFWWGIGAVTLSRVRGC